VCFLFVVCGCEAEVATDPQCPNGHPQDFALVSDLDAKPE